MNRSDIVFIIGTRPELIKIAPVVHALRREENFNFLIINTGQHRDLLKPYWKVFDIEPDYELDVFSEGQDLSSLTARSIIQINNLFTEFVQRGEKPRIVLAQGDTTTVMAAAMCAFYNKIKFAHLEAGLRTKDLMQPFPEEYNRRVASISAFLHLAPTPLAKENLIYEGISEQSIHVVGNTIVDALEYIRNSDLFKSKKYNYPVLNDLPDGNAVLITCHRRENHGDNLKKIVSAIEYLVKSNPSFRFVWIRHPNPNVKSVIDHSSLLLHSNFLLIDPLDYFDLLLLMEKSRVIITDSGGIQEESPSFGKPLIVLRDCTERPEAISAGMAKLVGSGIESIIEAFDWALKYTPEKITNPYGDGRASERVVKLMSEI